LSTFTLYSFVSTLSSK